MLGTLPQGDAVPHIIQQPNAKRPGHTKVEAHIAHNREQRASEHLLELGRGAAMATRCVASLPLLSASSAAAARAQPTPSAAAPRRFGTRLSVATGGEQQLITAQEPAQGELLVLADACY